MKIARSAWVWLGIACGPAALAQSPGCCTHQGASVTCPPGLPAGSRSLEFVPQGTLWGTPAGQSVMVPSTSFGSCPRPGSQAPPAAAPPPVATPRTPPPAASAPNVPAVPPVMAAPSGGQPPPTAATTRERERDRDRDRDRERARAGPAVRIPGTPPAGPPIVAVPLAPTVEEGKEADAAIGRMGALLRAQEKETQEKDASGTTCARPAPGKGGPGLGIAKGDAACDCEDPRVLKQEAPGGGKGKGQGGGGAKAPARAAAFRIEMHLVPHWRTVEAGKTHTLGTGDRARTGTVSGETLFGGIAGMSSMCRVTTVGCRGDCEKVIYDFVHVDLDINIAYVAGRRAQAAHESVHARQIGDLFRKALEGIEQTGAYPCSPPKDTPRRLQLCRERLELEVRQVGVAAVEAWYARRRTLQNRGEYFNDPEEIEAFAEENKGDAAAVFAPGVEPPPEFNAPAAPAGAASR